MDSWTETMRKLCGRLLLGALAMLVCPAIALACPVCFTATDSPMVNGVGMAILALLGVTSAVLACFAAFFVNLMRRARYAPGLPATMARPLEHGGHN